MASDLPVLRMRTNADNITKIKFIAKYNKRSVSKEMEMLLERHIAEFGKEHSEIIIEQMTGKQILEDLKDRTKGNPPYGD